MDRYYQAALVVPSGTTIAVPVEQKVVLENNLLVDIELEIPSGHAGFTGIRILSSHQQIIPFGSTQFIVADDYVRVFDWNEEVGANAISVQGYNLDKISHTFYLRFHVVNLPVIAPSTGSTVGAGGGLPVGITGGGGLPPVTAPPVLPPITVPTLPVPPVISPISGIGQPTAVAYNHHQESFMLVNG